MLHAELGHDSQPLIKLERLFGSNVCTDQPGCNKTSWKKVIYDDVIHTSLAEWRRTKSKSERTKVPKSIWKHLRRARREKKNGRIGHILDDFKDVDRLTHHARAPNHPWSPKKDAEMPWSG